MATGEVAELDELSTEELRRRAFALARQRHDRGFFWDVLRHLPHNQDATVIDESTGGIGEFVDEVVGLWREFTGHLDYGESEPLMRAKFIDYLSHSPESARETP